LAIDDDFDQEVRPRAPYNRLYACGHQKELAGRCIWHRM